MIVITLMIIIVGIVILIQTRKKKQQVPSAQPEIPSVSLREVLPPERTAAAEPALQVPPTATEVNSTAAPEAAATEPTVSVPARPAEPEVSAEVKALIEQAVEARRAGNVIASRDLLNDVLKHPLSEAVREEVKSQLSKLSERWLLSKEVMTNDTLTEIYKVKQGDLLANIGNECKVPYQILQQINGIQRPEQLQAGQAIKIIRGPFNAVVSRSRFTLDLYLQDKFVKSYKVGLGLPDRQTPTGLWRVKPGDKLIKPTWTDPDTGRTYIADDPDYPLGSRWIGLEGLEGDAKGRTGFAIHGTKDPETIGTQSSKGCIRLYNGDVIELYNLLFAGYSQVRVVD
jgi:lipoprotein-anchoring transpeptidase ErfK/SrfK